MKYKDTKDASGNTQTGQTIATMEGSWSPAPYYGVSTRKNFFGNSGFGYEYAFTYTSSYALEQSIDTTSETKTVDLRTYAAIDMISVNPSLFYAYGARDSTPDRYISVGVGVGAGYASVKGTAYLTDDSGATAACKTAVANGGVSGIKQSCEEEAYDESGFGVTPRLFLDGRWGHFYYSVDIVSLQIANNEKYDFTPQTNVITLTYIMELN